jgi:hypothetical protein
MPVSRSLLPAAALAELPAATTEVSQGPRHRERMLVVSVTPPLDPSRSFTSWWAAADGRSVVKKTTNRGKEHDPTTDANHGLSDHMHELLSKATVEERRSEDGEDSGSERRRRSDPTEPDRT